MSNTTITPTIGAVTAAGVALAMGLALAPVQAEAALAGLAAAATAVSPAAPAFGGLPLSWSALGANAAGASVGPFSLRQARFTAGGVFGSFGAVLIQASADNATWVTLAAMSDAVSPGAVLAAAPGLKVTPIAGGVVLSVTDPSATALRYLRPIVANGDAATALNVLGNLSTTGAV